MLVSICVPIYNVSQYIERCARSVFEQTYNDYEVIFVDDCSRDDSIEVLERVLLDYPNQKNKVRILHHNHNRGLAAVRNTAIDNAQGDFVMHVDSDDWLEPDALDCLVRKQQQTNADIVSGKAIAHYADHEILMEDSQHADKNEMILRMIELTFDHVIWRRLIRRSLYTDNGIKAVEGVNIGEDHHTLPKLIYYASKCVELDQVVYHYNCQNDNSYMKSEKDGESLVKAESDIASTNILIDFFKDKDARCYSRLNEIKATLMVKLMKIYSRMSQRKKYNALAKQLFQMPDNCISAAGLGSAWPKLVYRTYYGLALYKTLFASRKQTIQ